MTVGLGLDVSRGNTPERAGRLPGAASRAAEGSGGTGVGSGALSMGHARALLGLPDEAAQLRVAREIVSKGLSVRETEAVVKKATQPAAPKELPQKDVHTRAAEEKLRFVLGTRVRIERTRKGGRIEIDFESEDELQRLFEALTQEK